MSMEFIMHTAVLFGQLAENVVQAYISCGKYMTPQTRCYGVGAYCCGIYNDECCWETVYTNWWFWFIWAWAFILIVACTVCICIRRRFRRHAQPRYVIVETQPTYGAVLPQGYASQQGNHGLEQPAMAVPPTAPSYLEKPPPYSSTTRN